jgi:outer membrane receptor for ferrienterochelin and colicins
MPMNYIKKINFDNGPLLNWNFVFHTRFSNKIVSDYDTNPNQIIYDNINGYAIAKESVRISILIFQMD